MIAKSLLESGTRPDRVKATRNARGLDAGGSAELQYGGERRAAATWCPVGSAVASASDVAIRFPSAMASRAAGSDVGGVRERLPRLDVADSATSAPRGGSTRLAKSADRDLIDIGATEQRATLSGDDDGPQVILVLVMPKGVRDFGFHELAIDASRLVGGGEGFSSIKGAKLAVDVSSAIRLSSVRDEILASLARAMLEPAEASQPVTRPANCPVRLPNLTAREREVLQMILAGHPNKNIAADLGISIRTVENHRASVMKKTGSKSLPALVRYAIAAGALPEAPPPTP